MTKYRIKGLNCGVSFSTFFICVCRVPGIREENKEFSWRESSAGESLQNTLSQQKLRSPGQVIRSALLKPRAGRGLRDAASIPTTRLSQWAEGLALCPRDSQRQSEIPSDQLGDRVKLSGLEVTQPHSSGML